MSEELGVQDGKLAPCPDKPNCVSTQSTDEKNKMDSFSYSGTEAETIAKLKDILLNRKRTKIVKEEANYIRAEEKSKLFKFVDDIEFYLDETSKTVHFRSASRIGYSDFGVNRKRMEEIKHSFIN